MANKTNAKLGEWQAESRKTGISTKSMCTFTLASEII